MKKVSGIQPQVSAVPHYPLHKPVEPPRDTVPSVVEIIIQQLLKGSNHDKKLLQKKLETFTDLLDKAPCALSQEWTRQIGIIKRTQHLAAWAEVQVRAIENAIQAVIDYKIAG